MEEYAVIDLDTGTVMGTNVVLVRMTPEAVEGLESGAWSDSDWWEYGQERGVTLLHDDDYEQVE